MIRVRVSVPPGCSRQKLDEKGLMELPEGAMLSDVLKAIRMPKLIARLLMVSINGAIATPDTKLVDGDSIAFFSMVSGG